MSATTVTGKQIKDHTIQRVDIDVTTSGQALVTKIIAGTGISISSSGVDAGTGDVTINSGASGVSTVGTIDSQTKSSDGLVISGSSIYAQTADATHPGLISSTTQTIAGIKTFSSAPNLSSLTASRPLKLDGSKNITASTIDLTSANDVNNGTANQIIGANSGATANEFKTLATGTSGTDFAIAHTSGTITFNIPDASASNRGLITTGTQSLVGRKLFISNSGVLVTSLAVDLDANVTAVTGTPTLSTVNDNSSQFGQAFVTVGNNATGVQHSFLKTRATSTAASTIVSASDSIVDFVGYMADGTAYKQSSKISFKIDGTPGTNSAPGRIEFFTTTTGNTSAVRRWYIDALGVLNQDSTNGSNIIFNKSLGFIAGGAAAGVTTGRIVITGGNTSNLGNGGSLDVRGITNGSLPGNAILASGTNSGASLNLVINSSDGKAIFQDTNLNTLWAVDVATGQLQQGSANGGDIVFNKSTTEIQRFTTLALSGTGTTQSGATALVYGNDEITTITAASAEAFVLPTGVKGKDVIVFNRHATAAAKIFPASGAAIDSLSANAVYSLPALSSVKFTAKSATQWYTSGLQGTGISSIGTIDSQTKSSDGLVATGGVLYAQTADATHPGLVSTGAQTFAGIKTHSSDIVLSSTSSIVRTDTSDGSDNKRLQLFGGGGGGAGRGAQLQLAGNEHGNVGSAFLECGDASGAFIALTIGSSSGNGDIRLTRDDDSSHVMWKFSADGTLSQDATYGNDIIFNKSTTGIQTFTTLALSGTGTTQSGATALVYGNDEITTITAGSAEAFVLPTGVVGKDVTVFNRHATATAKIFPASGAAIDSLASNAVYSLAPLTSVKFTAKSATQWYTGSVGLTIGTIDAQTKSANGLVVVGGGLYAQSADASNPGLVTTGAQTFAGIKTFNSTPVSPGLTPATNGSGNIGTSSIRFNTINATNFLNPNTTVPTVFGSTLASDLQFNTNGVARIILTSGTSGQLTFKASSGYTGSGINWQTPNVNTTDATTTTLYGLTLTNNTSYVFDVSVIGRLNSTTAKSIWAKLRFGCYMNNSGNATMIGTRLLEQDTVGSPGYTVDVDTTTTDVRIRVTGAASETVSWSGEIRWSQVTTSA